MSNRFCELVGVDRPLQQAPMSRVATPELVAAVSNAGALGMLAVGRSGTEAAMAQIDVIDALTDRQYGAGFVIPFLDPACFAAVAERLSVVECFHGWPDPQLVVEDTITGWQVGTVDEARAAQDAGCGFVVAQGVEAGGHVRDTVPLDELLAGVAEAVDIPVVAAGGIGNRAAVDRAMELGADAVRVGTRFLGAREVDVHPRYRELLFRAGDGDTTLTDEYSVGWPDAPVRVLTSALEEARSTNKDPVAQMGERDIPRFSTSPPTRNTTGQVTAMALYAGLSVVDLVEPTEAAAIVHELAGPQ